MDSLIEQIPNPQKSAEDKIAHYKYGWKQLWILFAIVLIVGSFFSYLQSIGWIRDESLESQLFVPASIGLIMAVLNANYLVRISFLLLPIWFATATAMAFSGIFIIKIIELPYNRETYWWIDIFLEYLPAYLSGHWLFSGYGRMAKGISFLGYSMAIVSSLMMVFFFSFLDLSLFIVQPLYYSFLCFGLSLVHFGKIHRRFKNQIL